MTYPSRPVQQATRAHWMTLDGYGVVEWISGRHHMHASWDVARLGTSSVVPSHVLSLVEFMTQDTDIINNVD